MNDIKKLLDKYDYKIQKLLLKDKINIVQTNSGKFVIKENKNNDTRELFNYLNSKDFHNYLDYINDDQDNFMIFPFLYDNDSFIEADDKAKDLIYLIALLHSKTHFYKSYPLDEIKKFYEEKQEELNYLDKYYDDLRFFIEEQQFPSPSNYYLIKNISWIFHSINSSKFFLDKWYQIVKDKKNKRIGLIHGNLELDHLINSKDNKFIISWDNARNDMIIYDLITLYKKNYKYVSFYNLFKLYETYFPLLPEERYLLFSLILFPEELKLTEEEILNTKKVYDMIIYLQSSSEIISNYHSEYSNSKNNQHEK